MPKSSARRSRSPRSSMTTAHARPMPGVSSWWCDYLNASVVSAVLFALLGYYHILNRGYFDLYVANKVFGDVSLSLVALILLIGPLSRVFDIFDGWLSYRKELGILAMVFGVVHGAISYWFLPERFSQASYWSGRFDIFALGLIGAGLMILLWVISWGPLMRFLGQWWWRFQYWGIRLAGLAILAHMVVMKNAGWFYWFNNGGSDELFRPYLAPSSLLLAGFGTYVLIVRLSEVLGAMVARRVVQWGGLALVLFLAGSIAWGWLKLPREVPLTWSTCQRLPGAILQESYPAVCVWKDGRRAVQPIN